MHDLAEETSIVPGSNVTHLWVRRWGEEKTQCRMCVQSCVLLLQVSAHDCRFSSTYLLAKTSSRRVLLFVLNPFPLHTPSKCHRCWCASCCVAFEQWRKASPECRKTTSCQGFLWLVGMRLQKGHTRCCYQTQWKTGRLIKYCYL